MKGKFFERAKFMKPDVSFVREYTGRESAPAFRRAFYLTELDTRDAVLRVCGLGVGRFWINGKSVTEDLFIAPVSDYNKTLWVNEYNVGNFLQYGKNVIAIQLGNGFYNESFVTPWKLNEAAWRDLPKVIAELFIGGKSVVASGNKFRCKPETSTVFNQWRIGETYDARLEDGFEQVAYDASEWSFAKTDECPPTGIFRRADCEPVRECEELSVVSIKENPNGWVLDFGKNSSGYVVMECDEPDGTEITLRHAEEVDSYNMLKLNGLNILYPQVPFQTDRVICNGKRFVWKPKFVYHGFRYVEVSGMKKKPDPDRFKAVFVHQDVKKRSDFSCSDERIDWIYKAGIRASYSNMFYTLTDCPTREKYGWMNDAQASAEQLCLNFDMRRFFRKWMTDIADTMREDGDLSAVVPTGGYGYGHGPVADGALFEIPYRVYQMYGDEGLLCQYIPYFKKYLDFLEKKIERKEEIVLGDWDGLKSLPTSKALLGLLYLYRFTRITALALGLNAEEQDKDLFEKKAESYKKQISESFFNDIGDCTENTQTALSFLITEGFHSEHGRIVGQFLELMEKCEYKIDCGMVGMQYLFRALSLIGRTDLAFRVAVSNGPKSYMNWRNQGATTLWETWQNQYTDSKNHHMFSGIIGWFITDLAGYRFRGAGRVELCPVFVPQLENCRAKVQLDCGVSEVIWRRVQNQTVCTVYSPRSANICFYGIACKSGKNEFHVVTDDFGIPVEINGKLLHRG